MKAGGKNEGTFREIAHTFLPCLRLLLSVVSFLLFYYLALFFVAVGFHPCRPPRSLCSACRSRRQLGTINITMRMNHQKIAAEPFQ